MGGKGGKHEAPKQLDAASEVSEQESRPSYSSDFAPVLHHELAQVAARRKAVLKQEMAAFQCDDANPKLEAARSDAHRMDLFGLAFSGGGIRSATFNLGILQGVASLELLTRIDYLSSVSGGGYIGSWLAAWIRRESDKTQLDSPDSSTFSDSYQAEHDGPIAASRAVNNVQKQLDPSRLRQARANRCPSDNEAIVPGVVFDAEPEPIHHLRAYSRYLSPRFGIFSLDTLTLLSIYLRNLFANSLLFLATFIVIVLMCRLTTVLYGFDPPESLWRWFVLIDAIGLLVVAQLEYRYLLADLRRATAAAPADQEEGGVDIGVDANHINTPGEPRSAAEMEWGVFVRIVVPCIIAALLGLWSLGPGWTTAQSRMPETLRWSKSSGGLEIWQWAGRLLKWIGLSATGTELNLRGEYLIYALVFAVFSLVMYVVRSVISARASKSTSKPAGRLPDRPTEGTRIPFAGICAGFIFGLLLCAIVNNLLFVSSIGPPWTRPCAIAAFGVPLFLLAILASGYLDVVLSGPSLSEYEREWRGRVGALLIRTSAFWAALFSCIYYVPWLAEEYHVFRWATIVGWVTSGVATYLFRLVSAGTGGKAVPGIGNQLRKAVMIVAPYVFVAGLIALTSAFVQELPGVASTADGLDFIRRAEEGEFLKILGWLGIFSATGVVYMSFIHPNLFSLHSVYGNRLIRCYLGASRRMGDWSEQPSADRLPNLENGAATGVSDSARMANLFTGFGPRDDFSLIWLRSDSSTYPSPNVTDQESWKEHQVPYLGPYPLFNTTLNLVAGAQLAYQDRKGDSFVLTPDYCGSTTTGYAWFSPSEKDKSALRSFRNLSLGRAMTISGAAVDPNMRNYQSFGLTMLLTILNLRLGWWIRNPWSPRRARAWTADQPNWAGYLYRELFGLTAADRDFVHLTDGGHFENTGAYELIRRRCRFIVVVDAAEDPLDYSENLANLIRLVRTDFGIRIDVDTSPLHKDQDGISRAHVAVGVIRYDDVDERGVNGTLVFIRSSLTGDEPADIRNYAANNPPFPHQSTIDQFFDEDQFESYRMLGFHVARDVFGHAVAETHRRQCESNLWNRQFFAEVRQQWSQTSAASYQQGTAAAAKWSSWDELMRSDKRLYHLTLGLYPELSPAAVADNGRLRNLRRAADAALPQGKDWIKQALAPAIQRWLSEGSESRVAEFRAIIQLIGLMEATWMELNLSKTYADPLRRGWMNSFRRWTAWPTFHEYWPILAPQYSWEFVHFCERILNVPQLPVHCVRWASVPELVQDDVMTGFNREFFDEWSEVLGCVEKGRPGWEHDYLRFAILGALETTEQTGPANLDSTPGGAATDGAPEEKKPLVWVLTYGRPGETNVSDDPLWPNAPGGALPAFPIGVVAVRQWPPEIGTPVSPELLKLWQDSLMRLEKNGGANTAEKDPRYYELVVWIRGGYRTSEVGRDALPRLLKTIVKQLSNESKSATYLMVRFPRFGVTAANNLQRSMWSMFYNDNDFFSYRLDPEIAKLEVRLRRQITRQENRDGGADRHFDDPQK